MRLSKCNSFWVGFTYFLILLSIAFWVRDIPNQPDPFNLTLQQFSIGNLHMSDPVSFATGAIDIAKNGWISDANAWIFNLWPPGFVMLEALVITVFGPQAPVIFILQALAAVLFSVVLVLLYEVLKASMASRIAAVALPLLLFAFPVSRMFLLQPKGIILGESFSIGFFLLCILFVFHSADRDSLRYPVYGGLCLALSAYFRSQFEFILLVLSAWGVVLVVAIQLTRLFRSFEPTLLKSLARTIVVVLLVAHAATVPWRAYRWIYHYAHSPSWVKTTDLYYRNSVMTTEYLESIKGGWLVAGGGNLVCRLAPSACGNTANAKKLFFQTFIEHPDEWYSLKFGAIGEYWFASLRDWQGVIEKSSFTNAMANGLLLASIVCLVLLLFTRKVRSNGVWLLLVWLTASLFSAYLLIFTFAPLEVRYFYFPKIAGITMLLIVASLYWRSGQHIRSVRVSEQMPV